MRPPKKSLPLWIFALLRVPYGVYVGFIKTPLPFLLRAENVSPGQIANILSLIGIPSVLYFLWSPLVDFWLRRRTWLFLTSVLSAAILSICILQQSISTPAVILWITVGFAINLWTSAASGGLVATSLSDAEKSKASGWYQAGSLGAAGIAGGVILLAATHLSNRLMSLTAFLMIFIPAFAAFLIPENPPTPRHPHYGKELRASLSEVRALFTDRKNLLALLLLFAPIGSGAASSLYAGLAPEYHLTSGQIALASGFLGGLVIALGALLGPLLSGKWISDWDSAKIYVVSGLLNAVASLWMFLAPMNPVSFFVGVGLYLLTTGICFASFTSLVFSILGSEGRTLSSRYTILVSLANFPLIYMTWLEGRGVHAWGPRAIPGIDLFGNVIVAIVFFLIFFPRNLRKQPLKSVVEIQ